MVSNKKLIGFSTAFLHHTYPRVSKEIIDICREMGCTAIGLHCHVEELDLVGKLEKKDLDGFDFVAFHMPRGVTSQDFDILDKIQDFHNKLKFDIIEFHPDKIADWGDLKSYKLPFSIENMDARKEVGKSLESMKEIMSKNDFKVTLDVNHCYVNDASLKLADNLWDEFKDRISHFHLSGYQIRHEPLVRTQQKELVGFVAGKDRPIIIESVCKDLDEAKREFDYINNYLDNK